MVASGSSTTAGADATSDSSNALAPVEARRSETTSSRNDRISRTSRLAIPEVLARPFRQRCPRLLRNLQRPPPVACLHDLIQDAGHRVAQMQEILFASRGRVPLIAGGRRVAIGAAPVDAARRQRRHLQTRLLDAATRQRKDHAVIDAGEFAVADEARAVGEKQPEEHRIRRRGASHGRQDEETQHEPSESGGYAHARRPPIVPSGDM